MKRSFGTEDRKRPFTEAFLCAEEQFQQAKRQNNKFAKEIGSFRTIALGQGLPTSLDHHFRNIEGDIVSFNKELIALDEQFARSKRDLHRFVQEKLMLRRSFFAFLHGFHESHQSLDDPPPRSVTCLIRLLDLGTDTTESIKRSIADFAGVPLGKAYEDMTELDGIMRA